MRPTAVEVIRGIQAALAGHVLPEVSSRYAQAQVMYSIMLLEMLSKEWEEGAHLLTQDSQGLRRLLARGAQLIDGIGAKDAALDSLVADLKAAAGGRASPSLRMSDLREENERLHALLTHLGEACDRARDDERLSVLVPLWDDIIAHLREEAGGRAAPVPGR